MDGAGDLQSGIFVALTPLFKQTRAGRGMHVCNLKAWEIKAGGLPNIQGWHGLRGLRELAWHRAVTRGKKTKQTPNKALPLLLRTWAAFPFVCFLLLSLSISCPNNPGAQISGITEFYFD